MRWKKELLVLATALGLAGILSCGPSAPAVSQTALSKFYLTTLVAGWVPATTSHYLEMPAQNLYQAIDGPAVVYINAGLEKWFIEEMNGGPTHSSTYGDYNFNGFVEDYGDTANARALFDTITAAQMVQNALDTFSDTVPLPGFTLSEAQAKRFQGGISVFATFGSYYFEFKLVGYADPKTAAPDAVKFLTEYKALAQ